MQTLEGPADIDFLGAGARWSILAIALWATASSFLFINGFAFLIPALRSAGGIPLTQSSLLASIPSWGMVLTLLPWGYAVDRLGERTVLTVSSALTAVAAFALASQHSFFAIGALLFLGGMAAAGCNTAGGRLVSAWFPPHQRGVAMGIRQTAQPVGIALGALVMPELAEQDAISALWFPAVCCTIAAVIAAIGIADPGRRARQCASIEELANPYRESSVLWRIHAVSGLMMMPQAVTVTFMLVWLMDHRGWSSAMAGALVTACQLLGALGRIVVGRLSDRLGSRMQPVRVIALAAALTLFLLALTDHLGSRLDVWFMAAITILAVLDNGLEATAITEFAGPFWSGRALGAQNTTQRVIASVGPPAFGALISTTAYPLAWALCGLFPLLAAPLVPADLVPPRLQQGVGRRPGAGSTSN
ncbi:MULTISPECIES: MFS transporter [Mycobacterium]|nr:MULTISPECIES: MFS transporter [Mycobacterium]